MRVQRRRTFRAIHVVGRKEEGPKYELILTKSQEAQGYFGERQERALVGSERRQHSTPGLEATSYRKGLPSCKGALDHDKWLPFASSGARISGKSEAIDNDSFRNSDEQRTQIREGG